ncbi:MAG: hypothetical protein V2A74_08290, partial [bacterium]
MRSPRCHNDIACIGEKIFPATATPLGFWPFPMGASLFRDRLGVPGPWTNGPPRTSEGVFGARWLGCEGASLGAPGGELNLRRDKKNGAGNGARTRDIQLGKLTLYQL